MLFGASVIYLFGLLIFILLVPIFLLSTFIWALFKAKQMDREKERLRQETERKAAEEEARREAERAANPPAPPVYEKPRFVVWNGIYDDEAYEAYDARGSKIGKEHNAVAIAIINPQDRPLMTLWGIEVIYFEAGELGSYNVVSSEIIKDPAVLDEIESLPYFEEDFQKIGSGKELNVPLLRFNRAVAHHIKGTKYYERMKEAGRPYPEDDED
ncbi:hypothetical protein K6V98_07065 [Collinsella sp. AGMB00827]|uniref:Uncharacterized protein n=1 Tax=Collinsella ureilytica TaxID=2869515 RepID=A0ABS7MHG3_9ACTN|nr:hypothetical protein [Collinsella urealyticum]MBY4796794.1 hypothetical protein [Collinsella urealyticum]MBY4798103.1 hypothetical protein [Collinsella urealyticum]